ncbi:tail fiber assembly protein [Morganella morganii]|uniref:tail fiber assembly protein n=1 Tax=Morganella morganii TaxID=582 RepID=UPI001BDB8519|nr:tail fiber assembly protein [Morganella morganii]MBT0459845.1 tail fiber assembly protein [Morganella morganii subsp. morganii]
MKIYNYHPLTKEFLSEGIADADPLVEGNWLIPAHATTIPAPEIQSGYVPVFDGREWQQTEDHRGVSVYDITTAQESEIKELGELPDGVTTIAPDVEFPKWNGKKWVTDIVAKKVADIAAAEAQKQFFIAEANQKTQLWQTQLMLEIITDEDKTSLKEWMLYVQKVQAVDPSLGTGVVWPTPPASPAR